MSFVVANIEFNHCDEVRPSLFVHKDVHRSRKFNYVNHRHYLVSNICTARESIVRRDKEYV